MKKVLGQKTAIFVKFWVLVLGWPLIAYGQTPADGLKPGIQQDDPFEFVVRNMENEPRRQISSRRETSAASADNAVSALKYTRTLNDSPNQAKDFLETMNQKYGPPKSIRGNNHVWDVGNPNTHHLQAKMVTIIVSYEPNGTSYVVIDRDRGEDGSATYALPRREVPGKARPNSNRRRPAPPPPQSLNHD